MAMSCCRRHSCPAETACLQYQWEPIEWEAAGRNPPALRHRRWVTPASGCPNLRVARPSPSNPDAAAACSWVPACAGMTVSEETPPPPRHSRAGGNPEGFRALQHLRATSPFVCPTTACCTAPALQARPGGEVLQPQMPRMNPRLQDMRHATRTQPFFSCPSAGDAMARPCASPNLQVPSGNR